jgi:uroporphyrinogen-III synthase
LIKRIFISKDFTELAHLPVFCAERSLELIAQSCIQFAELPFAVALPYEVVFFGSVRAASFFLAQHELMDGVEVACIGETTATKLRAMNLPVAFVGEKAGNPTEVADAFKTWLGTRRVLFPLSSVSKESIVQVIPAAQAEKVVVYETRPKEQQFNDFDLAVFTSPSNLKSFLDAKNTIPALTIAWGQTTYEAMLERNITASYTLTTSTEAELISVLQDLINQ